jgi:hypothetical protein
MRESLLFPKWWFKAPRLNVGEVVQWSVRANRLQDGRAVGGKLFLTTTHLRFAPNILDAVLGGRSWDASRRTVTDVSVGADTNAPVWGSTRPLVVAVDGGTEQFITDATNAVRLLRQELALG